MTCLMLAGGFYLRQGHNVLKGNRDTVRSSNRYLRRCYVTVIDKRNLSFLENVATLPTELFIQGQDWT